MSNSEYYTVAMDLQGFAPGSELMVFPTRWDGDTLVGHPRNRFTIEHLEDHWFFSHDKNGAIIPVDFDCLEDEGYLELIEHKKEVRDRDNDTMIYCPEPESYRYKVLKKLYVVDACSLNPSILYGVNYEGDTGLDYLRSYSDDWEIFFEGDWSILEQGITDLIDEGLRDQDPELDKDLLGWTGIQIVTLWSFETESYNDYWHGPETSCYMVFHGVLDPDKIQEALMTTVLNSES